jgi:hypothetical protein
MNPYAPIQILVGYTIPLNMECTPKQVHVLTKDIISYTYICIPLEYISTQSIIFYTKDNPAGMIHSYKSMLSHLS